MTERKVSITIEAKDRTKKELARTRSEFDKTSASVAKAKKIMEARALLDVRPYKEVQAEIKKLRGAYDTLRKSGTLASAELYQAKTKLKQKTAELRKETGDWAGDLQKAKTGLIALAGAGYAVIKTFQRYSEFSQRMAEVNTLIDVSRERFGALGKEIRSLTKDIPQSAAELAAAEYDILSAGVALEKSAGVLEKSAKAAVAGVTDTKTAANVGIGVINAYGKSIDDLDEVYDTLFKTVKLGVTTFPELAQSIGEVLPTANAADVGLKELSASIATLTKAGIRTPKAMTALKGAINALAAPTPEAKKHFDELGITWQGLIPTLDAIREKGLAIDQMRLLIPDVEARTGVLALTQNFDSLKKSLKEMQGSGGAMSEAYDKMKDTPENQIKLFRNEVDNLLLSAGELVAKGLLPLAKAFRVVSDSIREADPVTKSIIGTLAGAVGAFTIWRLGLSHIVSGLGGFIAQARFAQASLGTLTAQFSASGIAMKAGLAAGAIYTSYQLATLAKEMYGARQAMKEAREAQDRLAENTGKVIREYEKFKDVKIPDDLTKLAREDLKELKSELSGAKAYYTALKFALEEKAAKKTLFGTATEEAREAQKQLSHVSARLNEVISAYNQVGKESGAAAEEMEKPARAVLATNEQLEEFEKQAKAAYENARKEAEKYAQEVIAWEEKIKYARLSTEDKIRELGRKGLSEEEVWADKKQQAEEKLYAAKKALREKDYELAQRLAKDAEALYADLAQEVKRTGEGEEVIVKSLEAAKRIAIAGVTEVGKFIEELYTHQKTAAETARDEWSTTANGINQQLNEISKARQANVTIELKGLSAAQNAINNLIKPATKHINVVVHQRTVEEKQTGGLAGLANGGGLPGYGGGDRIRALLEAGEFVVRKEAVRKYGAALFHALNSMRLDLSGVARAKIGGLISNIPLPSAPRHAYQTGGAVEAGSAEEAMTIRFQAGNTEMPLTVVGNSKVTRQMVKEFEKELVKLGLVRR